jgi:hypothetical protein
MTIEPVITRRPAQPYLAIPASVTAELLDWAAVRGLTWDVSPSMRGDRWGCRLEILHSDPASEPDMSKWVTELAFRLADRDATV